MARPVRVPDVKRRPSRGREDQMAGVSSLVSKLERAAKSGKMPVSGPVEPPVRPSRPVYQSDIIEEEDDGTLTLPPATPEDIEHAHSQSLSAFAVDEPDMDALWDAIRADEDRGETFLGIRPKTSAEMRTRLAQLGDLYTLIDDPVGERTRVGIAGFQDIGNSFMNAHIYLFPDHRGHGVRIIRQLMGMANDSYPGSSFSVSTRDAAMARMLRGVGFQASFLLTWAPVMITGPDTRTVDGDNAQSAELSGPDNEE